MHVTYIPFQNTVRTPLPFGSHFFLDNWTVEEILEAELAAIPTRDPLSVAIPMTVVYVVILLSGLLGNISTCIVIARNTYMHTATNYYLFRYFN